MLEKILITAGVSLVVVNWCLLKKEQKKSFKNALDIEKLNSTNKKDFEIEILNDEIEKLKKKIDSIDVNKKVVTNVNTNTTEKSNIIVDKENEEILNNQKQDKIKHLLDLGYSDEEICKDLKIGKGELQLIKKIYN